MEDPHSRVIVSPQLTKKDLDILSMDEEKLREVIEGKMLHHLGSGWNPPGPACGDVGWPFSVSDYRFDNQERP